MILGFDLEYVGNVQTEKREEVIQMLNEEVERLVRVSGRHLSVMTIATCILSLLIGCSACNCS